MEWSCNTGEGCALFVCFFGLQVLGLQDSGMSAATCNDHDCGRAMALRFCI